MEILLKDLIFEGRKYWKIPTFESEEREFQRISEEMGLSLDKLKESFKNGHLSMLTDKKWDRLKNTKSTKVSSFYEITQEIQRGLKQDPENPKDISGIRSAYDKGKAVDAPIVMFYEGDYHLIAGNARLMLAKAYRLSEKMKTKPWAYIFRHSE